jgi:hypothetical protein
MMLSDLDTVHALPAGTVETVGPLRFVNCGAGTVTCAEPRAADPGMLANVTVIETSGLVAGTTEIDAVNCLGVPAEAGGATSKAVVIANSGTTIADLRRTWRTFNIPRTPICGGIARRSPLGRNGRSPRSIASGLTGVNGMFAAFQARKEPSSEAAQAL